MDISFNWLTLLLSVIWLYGLITDMLKPDHFSENVLFLFGNISNANYSHSIIDYARNYAHSVSVVVATSVTSFISYLPVIKILFIKIKLKKLIISDLIFSAVS